MAEEMSIKGKYIEFFEGTETQYKNALNKDKIKDSALYFVRNESTQIRTLYMGKEKLCDSSSIGDVTSETTGDDTIIYTIN